MKNCLAFAFLFVHACCFASHVSPNLTAVYDPQSKVVLLKWQNNDINITSFILERSADNKKWVSLCQIESSVLNKHKIEKYTDKRPDPNKNYYRLKIISGDGKVEFSSSIIVIIGNPESSWVMYPVPVTTVLNLQYTGSDPIPGVVSVFIQNSQWKTLARLRSSSLVRRIEIPVSNLGKGIYDVKIMIMDRIVWNQRFVK